MISQLFKCPSKCKYVGEISNGEVTGRKGGVTIVLSTVDEKAENLLILKAAGPLRSGALTGWPALCPIDCKS